MRTDVFCYLIVAILAVLPTLGRADNNNTIGNNNRTQPTPCDPSEIGHPLCGKNQRCRVNNDGATCECQRDFHYVNDECVVIVTSTAASVETTTTTTTLKPEIKPESGGSSVAAGLLIPTFLIAASVLLYFGARRYKWLQRFRQYRHNRYGNVLVTRDDDDDDDDDDDPPIA